MLPLAICDNFFAFGGHKNELIASSNIEIEMHLVFLCSINFFQQIVEFR